MGCRSLICSTEDAQVQVLERYPSDFHLLRTVKVQIAKLEEGRAIFNKVSENAS
jgi:hypothetical protein